ncbi:MAG: tetratricopeptide repeat protein [Muribaculaceae bacterium]|nr:tetratricopeptide repeat protein [Muribaculaceae bacterium]
MKLKAVFLICAISAPASMLAQPSVAEYSSDAFINRATLLQEMRNYVGSSHQLWFHNSSLTPTWNNEVEAEFMMAINEFELGNPSSLTMLEEFIENHPNEPLALTARAKVGDYYFYHGDFAQARECYEQVREKALDDDYDENVLYRKAYCDLMLKDYNQAKEIFDKLSTTKQYATASTFFKGYIEYAYGQYDSAMDYFEKVDRSGDLGYQAQYYMCQIMYKQGDYNNAVRLGESLIEDNLNDYFSAEMNRVVGESYYRLGSYSKAAPYLSKFLEISDEENEERRPSAYMLGVIDYGNRDYQGAIETLAEVTGVDDALAQSAYLYIGQSRLKCSDYNGASMAFERAANMRWDNNVRETAFYNYAISQSKGGRTPFNNSIDMFEQFLNEYPNSSYYSNVENYLIDAYTTTSDYDRALRSIANINNPSDKVLKAKQNVLYHKGVQQLRNNKPDNALNSLKEAVDMGKKDNEIYNNSKLWLAEAQYQLGDYKSAAANQQEFINAVTSSDPNYGLALYNAGSSLFNQQDYTKAIGYFEKAIESNSLSREMTAEAYNRIGDAYYYGKNFNAAVENYTKASRGEVDASSEYAILRKAIIAGDMSQYDSKIQQLDELLANYPNSSKVPEAMLEKGNAQILKGDVAGGINSYSKLISKYPNQPEAREAMLKMAIAEKSRKNEDKAIATYWNVIETYPASEEAKIAAEDLKLIYAQRDDLMAFSSRLNSIPGGPKIDVKKIEKAAFDAAESYYIDYNNISKLENYLRDYPDGAYVKEAKYYIGYYYYTKNDYNSAMEALTEALDGNEDATFAQRTMALKAALLLQNGNPEEAYNIYEMWAEKATNSDNLSQALLGMVRSASEAQQWRDVINSANELLNFNNTLNAELEQEVTLSRAIAYRNIGKSSEAMADLRELASNTQSEAGAQAAYELAQMQYDNGEIEDAEETLNAFIASNTPHNYWLAKGFILLCDIFEYQGKTNDAIDYLKTLKTNYPGKEGEIFNEIDARLNKLQKSKK